MKRLTSWILCWLLAVPAQLLAQIEITAKPLPSGEVVERAPGQATASDLLRAADKSIAKLVDAARNSNDRALDPNSEQAKPFWNAVKTANEAVAKAERGLFLQEDTFFSSMAEAHSAVIEAQVGLRMSGSTNASVREALGQSAEIMGTLQQSYSKVAGRLREGAELSTQELAQLDKLKQEQTELQSRLSELEGKVGKNETMIEGLREVQKHSQTVTSSGSDVGAFVGGMLTAHLISSLLWGWHWWWGPWGTWVPGFCYVHVDIWYDSIDYLDYDWALADELVDVEDLDYLDDLDALDEADLTEADEWLGAEDFALGSDEMMGLAEDLEVGWDDLDGGAVDGVLDGYADDFGHSAVEEDLDMDTFDDVDLGLDDVDDWDF